MKLLILLTCAMCFEATGHGFAQTVSLDLQRVTLETAFKEIRRQTQFRFVYTRAEIKSSHPVSISSRNQSLSEVLQIIFKDQPLGFVIEGNHIVVHQKIIPVNVPVDIDVKGNVSSEDGGPIAGASVEVKDSKVGAATDENGNFFLSGLKENDILIFSSIGFQRKEIRVGSQQQVNVILSRMIGSLDETVVMAYGKTTHRYSIGNIGKVRSEEITRQPVSNPIAALQGRVPGLFITQSNGLPGSNFEILIRGRNSIQQGTSPLVILDGVPLSIEKMNQTTSNNANNPLNTIDPADIASIEVLKDADATAIYGSRGANGVILITTKRFKAEKPELHFSFHSGWGRVSRTMEYMKTPAYLQMRKEAFANDGTMPTVANAVDLLVWDSSRYTNWTKELIGHTANVINTNLRYQAGSTLTKVSIHGGLYKEGTVYGGDLGNTRLSSGITVTQKNKDGRFYGEFVFKYTVDKSKLFVTDPTQNINLAPNAPSLYDSAGNIRWYEKGVVYYNPIGLLLQDNVGTMSRLSMSSILQYRIFKGLTTKVNFGFNKAGYDETSLTPIKSQHPSGNPRGSAAFASSGVETLIVEPQADYSIKVKLLSIHVIAGGTFQKSKNVSSMMRGSGYTSDLLLKSIGGAATVATTNNKELYRYVAAFTRVSFNYDNRYLLNLTGRRDGSSRFGPGKQFANFGAVGAGWIFSKEKFMTGSEKWLSFGKLRGSFGVTGNDQIRNYQYLDTWSNTSYTYGGIAVVRPTKLFNPDYRWEQSKKMEAAIELGFLKDRIIINASMFRSLSGNQIISYLLPAQTGFTGVLMNFPGLVRNSGLELSVTSINFNRDKFKWSSTFNLTSARNRLLAFPGLEGSSYAGRYHIGHPLNINNGYEFKGVNPQTGVYEFTDRNNDGLLNTKDQIITGSMDPKFYGGLDNMIQVKNLEVNFLLQFVKQEGRHFIYSSFNRPGFNAINQYTELTKRWTKPGEVSPYQRYTATAGTAAYNAASLIPISTALLTDASYIRLKTLSLYYEVGKKLKMPVHHSLKVYLQAQNLLTLTSFVGADPEISNAIVLPSLRMIAAGIQVKF